ncbi:MAG TPA: hypothetical protein VFR87_11760 [Nocardioidaceae bacterium]|nr:hypothetical protein [Nocardioidaceae bacterium]
MTNQDLLAIYLNDHLGASTAGVELIRRAAGNHDGERGAELSRLADEIAEDRESLRDLMKRLDVSESTVKKAAGWLGEKAGRLKPNDHLVSRSPLSDVLEIEMLRAGTAARICGFQVLRAVAVEDGRVGKEEIEHLIDRAQDQEQRLYKIHIQLAQENLAQQNAG